jgi:hypothetical protein
MDTKTREKENLSRKPLPLNFSQMVLERVGGIEKMDSVSPLRWNFAAEAGRPG